jgi:hypothetical protein
VLLAFLGGSSPLDGEPGPVGALRGVCGRSSFLIERVTVFAFASGARPKVLRSGAVHI